jgi:hypothetical protein
MVHPGSHEEAVGVLYIRRASIKSTTLLVVLSGTYERGFRMSPRGARATERFGEAKSNGSLTSWPGRESHCELSGTGWRADLYRLLASEKVGGDLPSDKLEERFSATGR